MDTSTFGFWLQLCATPGLGAARLAELATAFDDSGNICENKLIELAETLPKASRQRLIYLLSNPASLHYPQVEEWLRWADLPNNRLLVLPDPGYPAMLRLIADPPPLLFATGQSELLWQPQIAIVGSRSPTISGREHACHFAHSLATSGFTVTSGLALGIDGAAHQGALQQLGSTVAVLGSGLNIVYPTRHRQLAHRIADTGLLISEFALDTPPKAANFPKRNRIISGLSLGTLVIEASIRSGSLITARMALEQGREVFAMPGSIHNPQVRGCHQLIKQGAKLVETTDDIFSELPQLMRVYQQRQLTSAGGFSSARTTAPNASVHESQQNQQQTGQILQQPKPQNVACQMSANAKMPEKINSMLAALDKESQQVLDAVGFEATHTDHIVERTGLRASEVQAQLMQLELIGLVRSERGGVVRVS